VSVAYLNIGGVTAHNARKTDRARVRASLRDDGTAHTEDNVVMAAVFHAPMFASNAFA
jgi:hypothetical protein